MAFVFCTTTPALANYGSNRHSISVLSFQVAGKANRHIVIQYCGTWETFNRVTLK